MRQIRADEPGMTDECLDQIRWGGIEALSPAHVEDCYKFEGQRRWKGLLRTGFETSRFCPAPAGECSDEAPGEHVWLAWKEGAGKSPYRGEAYGGLYAVDFIGRKTAYPGHYGHMGMSDQEIVGDRLISIKRIEAPPPEPTKADVIRYWKACQAVKTCTPNWSQINKMKE